MKAELYSIASLPARLVRRWDEMLHLSPIRTAFLSHAFCAAVEQVRGSVFVLHIRNMDEEGFLPFQIRRGRVWLGHAEKVGGSMSDFFGTIGTLRTPIQSDQLLNAAGLSCLRLDHGVMEACPFSFADSESSRGVRVEVDSFSNYIAVLSSTNKSFINGVRRKERSLLADMGEVEFTWNTVNSGELGVIIDAKREQYRRTGTSDALAQEWRRQLLYDLFSSKSNSYCVAVLSTMYCKGLWVASNLSLVCEDSMHIWFPAHNTALRRYWPGHLLFLRIIEHGCRTGIRVFDFGQGESHYKAEYIGELYELWKGVIRRRNLSGYAERLLQSFEWRYASWRQQGIRSSAASGTDH